MKLAEVVIKNTNQGGFDFSNSVVASSIAYGLMYGHIDWGKAKVFEPSTQ